MDKPLFVLQEKLECNVPYFRFKLWYLLLLTSVVASSAFALSLPQRSFDRFVEAARCGDVKSACLTAIRLAVSLG